MTPTDFLRQVWPDIGIYCLVTPAAKGWRHHLFDTIEEAADWAEAHKAEHDTFFAVHSLRSRQYWNKDRVNKKTGEVGRWEIRSHPNMLATRCFFADLDVGSEAGKYASQVEAVQGLKQFCATVKLPAPTITSSGRGIHVYWLFDSNLTSEEWRPYAFKLHQLIRHYHLLVDHTKVTDQSAVLRVPGTLHLKDPNNPREVQVLRSGSVTALADMLKLIDEAVVRAGLTVRSEPLFKDAPVNDLLGSNLVKDYGPPPRVRSLLRACAQMRFIAGTMGNVPEPVWYHGLIGVMQFVENGRELVHKFSGGYAGYSRDETDAKLDQWPGGVSSCAKIAEKNGDSLCDGCIFAKANRNPIWAARNLDEAATPVATYTMGTQQVQYETVDPPAPYRRLTDGRIGYVKVNKDGDQEHGTLIDHDLYPLRRLSNRVDKRELQAWRAVLPRSGPVDFELEADALYDKKKLLGALAHNGVYLTKFQQDDVIEYMIAYIKRLQAETDAEAQMTHMGWTEDLTGFILPDRIIQADGTSRPSSLTPNAAIVAQNWNSAGTLERQVELLKFYDHDEYLPNQFFILCSLAAPLFYHTGHHGAVINATGDPGASKSTSLYTAASLWGNPVLVPLNGTQTGSTTLARQSWATTLANLPLCVDEVTHMDQKQARDLAMGVSQPGGRQSLTRSGTLKPAAKNLKATLMLTTANSSLHAILANDNTAGTAGSMRVFEIRFRVGGVHSKRQADDYLHELKQNYGHIGVPFMSYCVRHNMSVGMRIRAVMQEIDASVDIDSSERFWTATAAAAIVAAEIAQELGLLTFNPMTLKRWIIKHQIPEMRGVVQEEYTGPVRILGDFLERHHTGVIVTQGRMVSRAPHGEMVAHYDTLSKTIYVNKTAFKNHCAKIGANSTEVMSQLMAKKIITNKQYRTTLGRGTEHAKIQSWTFIVDAAHPEICDNFDTLDQGGSAPGKVLEYKRG